MRYQEIVRVNNMDVIVRVEWEVSMIVEHSRVASTMIPVRTTSAAALMDHVVEHGLPQPVIDAVARGVTMASIGDEEERDVRAAKKARRERAAAEAAKQAAKAGKNEE